MSTNLINNNNMKKIRKYVKSKPLHLVILEVYAFGVLMPLALSGILFMIVGLITGDIDPTYANFGIYN